ncbi:hypothetical protein GCM10010520_50790 [Rhizobium viscosum]
MPILQQSAGQMKANEACRSRNEVAHFNLFLGSPAGGKATEYIFDRFPYRIDAPEINKDPNLRCFQEMASAKTVPSAVPVGLGTSRVIDSNA